MLALSADKEDVTSRADEEEALFGWDDIDGMYSRMTHCWVVTWGCARRAQASCGRARS